MEHRPIQTEATALGALVRAAQTGDPLAFRELVARFEGYALARSRSLLKDSALAEDAAQEAFIEASLKLHQLREPEAFPGWFARIMFKRCDRFLRGRKSATAAIELARETPAAVPPPEMPGENEEKFAELRKAIEDLPERERALVEAFYLEERAQKEIVLESGLPLTTVKKRLYSARQRLRRRLTAWESADGPDAFSEREELFMAAWNGFAAKAEALLRRSPGLVHTRNDDGMDALLFAAHAMHYTGRRGVIEVLLRCHAPIHVFAAAALGMPDELTAWIRREPAAVAARGVWERTPLHWAVCGGHTALALGLLDRGAPLNAADCWGCTALHLAADFGHDAILDALLARGAHVTAAMKNGKLPLHLAASHGRAGLVRRLLESGARLDLFAAAALGDLRLAERLLERDPAVLHTGLALGATPLQVAAECRRAGMARFLLERGAALDLPTAAQLGDLEEVRRMLEQAPDTVHQHTGSFGFTPLHYASVSGRRDLAHILLNRGARVDVPDRMFQKTPLDEALFFGREALARLLLRHRAGADPGEDD